MYTQKKPLQNKRWSDITSLGLIFLLFLLASTRLQITHWALHIDTAGWLLLIGAALGYAVGRTRFHTLISLVIILFYSLFTVPATLLVVASDKVLFSEKTQDLILRMATSARQLLANQPVTDSILFIVGMGLLFWILGTAAGFSMARTARPWIPILILGGALLLIEHYQPDSRRIFYSWAYTVLSLILLGRIYYLKLRNDLQQKNVQIGEETNFEFTRGVIIAAIVLALAGLLFPTFSRIFIPGTGENTVWTERWNKFTSNFEHLVFALDQPVPKLEDTAAGDLDLGTGQPLGENQVLYIEADQPAPYNRQFLWRVRTYDLYESGKWSSASTYKQYIRPNQQIPLASYQDQIIVKLRFTSSLQKLVMLYAPGQPIRFSRQFDAAITSEGDAQADLVAEYTSPAMRNGENYRVESGLSAATSLELGDSSVAYPGWIKDRYLQLPADLSPRMKTLAFEITKDSVTPYDKAAAITSYLRKNIQYQAQISAPPRNQDPVDWFLFDYKKGFCNYYASAEVLLLRVVGVPARLAVGYAQGEQGGAVNNYLVREKDSHAWPEVYFMDYGWIPFEPTGSQPVLDYTAQSTQGSIGPAQQTPGNVTQGTAGYINGEDRAMRMLDEMDTGTGKPAKQSLPPLTIIGKILLGLVSVVAVGLITFIVIKLRKNRVQINKYLKEMISSIYLQLTDLPWVGGFFIKMRLSPIERTFWPVQRGLHWAGETLQEGITAHEMADRFIQLFPESKAQVEILLQNYQKAVYGNEQVDLAACRKIGMKIDTLINKAAFRRFTDPIRRLNQRFGG